MACDPNTLIEEAKCVQACIPPHMIQAATLAALCRFGAAAASNPSLTDIVAYWKMDEAGSVQRDDASGNAHHLSVAGTVNSGTGKINNGAVTNGVAANRLFSADAVFSGVFPFTAFCWVNIAASTGTLQSIMSHFDPNLFTSGWKLFANITPRFGVRVSDGAGPTADVIHATPVVFGTFFLIIVTFTAAGSATIRVNNGADTVGAIPTVGNPAVQFRIGGDNAGGDCNGVIDEAGIYNRVLTSAEKDALWNAGAGKQYPFT